MCQIGKKTKWILMAALLIMAILSITLLGPKLSTIDTYDKVIEILDDKKLSATGISTTVTAASIAITFLPEDKGTPLAEELAEFSSALLLVVCALQLEKFLLTTFGGISGYIIAPTVCIIYIISLIFDSAKLRVWGTKLLLIAILFASIVPMSVKLTKNIEDAHAASVGKAYERIQTFGTTFDHTTTEEDAGFFTKLFKGIAEGVSDALATTKEILTMVIDAISVLLITSCVIPLITFLLFIWLIKLILTGKTDGFSQPYQAFKKKVDPVMKKINQTIREEISD